MRRLLILLFLLGCGVDETITDICPWGICEAPEPSGANDDDQDNEIIIEEETPPPMQPEVGQRGAPGRDGKDGVSVVGAKGDRGERGLPGQNGSSCSATDLSGTLFAPVVYCTDGSKELMTASIKIQANRTWNPTALNPASHVLAYPILFEIPQELDIVYEKKAKTGNGWSYLETDSVRYCYKPDGSSSSNDKPQFRYAANLSNFSGDCSTLANQTGAHLNVDAGGMAEASTTLTIGVSGGTPTSNSSLATLILGAELYTILK